MLYLEKISDTLYASLKPLMISIHKIGGKCQGKYFQGQYYNKRFGNGKPKNFQSV